MTTPNDPAPRGCRVDPQGKPLTLGDMRRLIARADELGLPDGIVPRFSTPLPPRSRFAVTITLLDDGPAATLEDVPQTDPDFDPVRYGADSSRIIDP